MDAPIIFVPERLVFIFRLLLYWLYPPFF
jgi:hypothetical protein